MKNSIPKGKFDIKATEEILIRFEKSWEETENFYSELICQNDGWGKVIPILELIQSLKSRGENKFFRIGTSIHHLIISRSVEPYLRDDQKFIRIIAENDKFIVAFSEDAKMYREYTLSSLKDRCIVNLLKTLKDTLVD